MFTYNIFYLVYYDLTMECNPINEAHLESVFRNIMGTYEPDSWISKTKLSEYHVSLPYADYEDSEHIIFHKNGHVYHTPYKQSELPTLCTEYKDCDIDFMTQIRDTNHYRLHPKSLMNPYLNKATRFRYNYQIQHGNVKADIYYKRVCYRDTVSYARINKIRMAPVRSRTLHCFKVLTTRMYGCCHDRFVYPTYDTVLGRIVMVLNLAHWEIHNCHFNEMLCQFTQKQLNSIDILNISDTDCVIGTQLFRTIQMLPNLKSLYMDNLVIGLVDLPEILHDHCPNLVVISCLDTVYSKARGQFHKEARVGIRNLSPARTHMSNAILHQNLLNSQTIGCRDCYDNKWFYECRDDDAKYFHTCTYYAYCAQMTTKYNNGGYFPNLLYVITNHCAAIETFIRKENPRMHLRKFDVNRRIGTLLALRYIVAAKQRNQLPERDLLQHFTDNKMCSSVKKDTEFLEFVLSVLS